MQETAISADTTVRPGFDFTGQMRVLCADMVARLPDLGHIDLPRVAVRYCQARKAVSYGIQATLTPLRFAGGQLFTVRRGRRWTLQRLYDPSGREMLYLLSFYLPRFLERPLEEKLATVVHELWHISPQFDGDLRRHAGRCFMHTHSQRQYDRQMHALAQRWLAEQPDDRLYGFLLHDFAALNQAYGPVYGAKIPRPKLVPHRSR